MTKAPLLVGFLLMLFLALASCQLPIFQPGSPEQAALRQEIEQQYLAGTISKEVRDGMIAALDSVGSFAQAQDGFDWQKLLAALLGLGGTVLGGAGVAAGRRATTALAERGPAKPLDPAEVEALKSVVRERIAQWKNGGEWAVEQPKA